MDFPVQQQAHSTKYNTSLTTQADFIHSAQYSQKPSVYVQEEQFIPGSKLKQDGISQMVSSNEDALEAGTTTWAAYRSKRMGIDS